MTSDDDFKNHNNPPATCHGRQVAAKVFSIAECLRYQRIVEAGAAAKTGLQRRNVVATKKAAAKKAAPKKAAAKKAPAKKATAKKAPAKKK